MISKQRLAKLEAKARRARVEPFAGSDPEEWERSMNCLAAVLSDELGQPVTRAEVEQVIREIPDAKE